jgi:hypothetical protein
MPSDHGRADNLTLGRDFSDNFAAFLSEEETKGNDMVMTYGSCSEHFLEAFT